MSNYRPDKDFIAFAREELYKNGDKDEPFIGSSSGTKTRADLIKEMQNGSKMGRNMYKSLFNNPKTQKLFQKWKTTKSKKSKVR